MGDVVPVGQTMSMGLGQVAATPGQGWGRETWGWGEWNGSTESINVTVSGLADSISLASVTVETFINTGWGRHQWGERAWVVLAMLLQ